MSRLNELFNFDIGSGITGESTYDIWKKVTGKEDYSEFLEFIRTGPQGVAGLSAYESWLTIEGNEGKIPYRGERPSIPPNPYGAFCRLCQLRKC